LKTECELEQVDLNELRVENGYKKIEIVVSSVSIKRT